MPRNNVTLFGGYIEEGRKSMAVYASNLCEAIHLSASNIWNVNVYQPSMVEWDGVNKITFGIRLRYSKYLCYPLKIAKQQGNINHIVDQSYSYLLNFIDSDRSIVTVHDLIPIIGWEKKVMGLTYPHYPLLYKLSISSLHKARAIIAVSENTKKDLVKYCGISSDKISVIYNGINKVFRSEPKVKRLSLRRNFHFPDKAYVILITGYQEYKNHLTSFKVIDKLQGVLKKTVQLVWLGGTADQCEKLSKQVDLDNSVIRLSGLNLEQLVSLYNSVDCLLFPSWYEGFGWPPLEAMACGVPVICSNVGPIPEVVANAAITHDPSDIDGLVNSVKTVLTDEDKRNSLIDSGYSNIQRFSWDRCASQVESLYQQVLT